MENKNQNFKKHSKTGTIISAIGIIMVLISVIVFIIVGQNKENEITNTKNELISKDSLTTKLNDTLQIVKQLIQTDKIQCVAYLRKGDKMPNGLAKYDITFSLTDSLLVSKLKSVGYYFNSPLFKPQLKTSIDSLNSFKKSYVGYGCIDTVRVYLHYKNLAKTATLFVPMCEKSRIELPIQ